MLKSSVDRLVCIVSNQSIVNISIIARTVILNTTQEQMVADILMYGFLVNAGIVHIQSNEISGEALSIARLVNNYMVHLASIEGTDNTFSNKQSITQSLHKFVQLGKEPCTVVKSVLENYMRLLLESN